MIDEVKSDFVGGDAGTKGLSSGVGTGAETVMGHGGNVILKGQAGNHPLLGATCHHRLQANTA